MLWVFSKEYEITNRVKSRYYVGKTPTEVTKLPQKSMAILHGKRLQDLSHCIEGPDQRGSELTVDWSCKRQLYIGIRPQYCRKETRIVVAMI